MNKQKTVFWSFLVLTFISIIILPIIFVWDYLGRGILRILSEYLIGKYTMGFLFGFMGIIIGFWYITIPSLIISLVIIYFVFKRYNIKKIKLYMVWTFLLFIDIIINIAMYVFRGFD